jgi:hypothetical protein
MSKKKNGYSQEIRRLLSLPVDERLLAHARRLAVEYRAFVSEANRVLAPRADEGREGLKQTSSIELAISLLNEARAAHEVECNVRRWMRSGLSEFNIVLVVGVFGEERSLGFIAGLMGEPRTCVWVGPRAKAWERGYSRGRYLYEREQSRVAMGKELPM